MIIISFSTKSRILSPHGLEQFFSNSSILAFFNPILNSEQVFISSLVCVQYFYSIILETFSSAFRLMCSIMFIFTTKTFLLQPSLKNFSPKKIESWNIGLPRKNVLIKLSNTAYSKDQPIKHWLGSKKKVR